MGDSIKLPEGLRRSWCAVNSTLLVIAGCGSWTFDALMTQRRKCLGLALVVALGCAARVPPATRTEAAAAPSRRCVADDLGPLEPNASRKNSPCRSGPACGDACARGDAIACYVRGVELEEENPRSGEPDGLYLSACRAGVAIACTNYAARMWIRGDAADGICARRVFEKTCAVDDPFGCGMFGRLLVDEVLVPGATPPAPEERTPAEREQLRRSRESLERSCQRLGHFSCRVLALEIERGVFSAPDEATVQRLLARACETGDENACGPPPNADSTFHPKPR
jgi:hypothetical protein